jgi:hypothetical protein
VTIAPITVTLTLPVVAEFTIVALVITGES